MTVCLAYIKGFGVGFLRSPNLEAYYHNIIIVNPTGYTPQDSFVFYVPAQYTDYVIAYNAAWVDKLTDLYRYDRNDLGTTFPDLMNSINGLSISDYSQSWSDLIKHKPTTLDKIFPYFTAEFMSDGQVLQSEPSSF